MARWDGLAEFDAWAAQFAPGLVEKVEAAIDKSADEFVATVQPLIPVSDLDPHPGALQASVRKIEGSSRLAKKVIADAKDDRGREYGGHAELGHMAKGHHVAGFHVWYPTWRLLKKKSLARIRTAWRASLKGVYGKGGGYGG